MPALVDVVVPVFNRAQWLGETIASVAAQDEVAWSVVVVDDGSSDESVAQMERLVGDDPRIRLVRRSHGGTCAARNSGAAASGGDLLLFLDSDDRLLPGALATLARALENPAVRAAQGNVLGIDGDGRRIQLPGWWAPRLRATRHWLEPVPQGDPIPPESFLIGAMALPCSVLVRRSAFDAAGGWDETHGQFYEDTDLWARVALGGGFVHVDADVAEYRLHSEQGTADAAREAAQREALLRKWRSGSPPVRAAAAVVDHRAVPQRGLHVAWESARRGRLARTARFAFGALRAYRWQL